MVARMDGYGRIAGRIVAALVALAVVALLVPPTVLGEGPGLTVTVTHDAVDGAAELGSSVTFTYTVTNTGDVPVVDISVDDSWAGHVGDIPSLDPTAEKTFTRTLTITDAMGGTGTCVAHGVVGESERVEASGSYQLEVFIGDAFADFAVDKRLVAGDPIPNGVLTYRITVRNVDGTTPDRDAPTVSVVDEFDPSRARVADAAGGVVARDSITWEVPAPPDADSPVVIEYQLRVDADAAGRLLNTVTISNRLDLESGNDADAVSVAIAAAGTGGGPGADSADDPAGGTAGDSGSAAVEQASGAEPYLPFTGAPLVPTVPLAVALLALGASLRRLAR